MVRDQKILIPETSFTFGGDSIVVEGEEYLAPARQFVTVESFVISSICLSRGFYLEYLLNTRRPVPKRFERWAQSERRLRLPVTGISHKEASECAEYYGGRLPSEVEWELAFRGPNSLDLPKDMPANFSPLILRNRDKLPVGYFGTHGGMCYISEWTCTVVSGGWAVAKGTPYMMKQSSLARRFLLRRSHRWAMTGFRVVWGNDCY